MSQEPNIWYVRGTIHNADGSVFYNQGRIMAYHVIPQSGWEWIAEADIDSNTGAFELEFHTSNFQKLDFPPIDLPKLQIRVTDYGNNPLWISDIYTAPTAEMNVGDIVVNGGANEVWNVCGIICDSDNSPYTVGSIKVFDVRNEVENELGSCQLNQEGFYSVNYTTGMFQQGDTSIERPNLLVRVYSSDESVVQSIEGPNVATNFEIINIEVPAQESGGDSGSSSDCDCKIYGTIKNTLNYPLKDNIEVAAFCLYYQEGENGSFVKVMLGSPVVPDAYGYYEIKYSSSKIPAGLKLDSNVAYGKDKASLFAEIHYTEGGTGPSSNLPRSFYSAPLVFNGQSSQEINFVLDLESSCRNKSEFEKIDELLNIYYQTVIAYDKTILTEPHDRIAEFLDDVTRLPLVVGRENLDEQKVRAYFKAFQMAHEMLFVNVLDENNIPLALAAQYLYSLILNNKIADISSLIALGLDKCIGLVNAALADNVISSTLSAEEFDEKIWKKLQTSKEVVTRQDDQLSPLTFFYLLLAKEYWFGSTNKKPSLPLLNENSTDTNDIIFRAKLYALVNTFEDSDCNYHEMVRIVEKNGLSYVYKLANGTELLQSISEEDVENLKLLVEIRDFCDGCADLIFGLYNVIKTYAICLDQSNQSWIKKLEDIFELENEFRIDHTLRKDDDETYFWGYVINQTKNHYKAWCTKAPLDLPSDYFPGTTADEQTQIALRTLKNRLRKKFPQKNLTNVLTEKFPIIPNPYSNIPEEKLTKEQIHEINEINEQNAWSNLIAKLANDAAWANFDLNSSDLELFLNASADAHEEDGSIPKAEASEDEFNKIKALQRLFRLTNNQEAVAYLIKNDFDSAAKIALIDEEQFVAEHGLGMGDKELATNIHRLAKNFVANATLDVERYHGSLNESGDSILSIPRGFQRNEGEEVDPNIAGEPSGNEGPSGMRGVLRGSSSNSSNVAKQRLQNKDYANWKTLFKNLNRNPGTQNQSILSPSAYLLDLLEFLKQGHAYNRFVERRPDILKLNMTKANAEVSLPTIDLAIELLESLVSKESKRYDDIVVPFCNQTPDDATVENLRANPCPWYKGEDGEDNSGSVIETAAMAALGNKCYPMLLLKNFDRVRASGILENLSLDFVSLSRKLHDDLGENISILLNGYAPEYLSNDASTYTKDVWELWGLNYDGNEELFFPDKSRRVKGEGALSSVNPDVGKWFNVLSYLAFVLDRAQLTYDEFVEIFNSSVFQACTGVSVNADSVLYQLADVNGYTIEFENDDAENSKKKEFYFKLSVFVRRRAALGWSVDEVARTWECDVAELASIQELKTRLGVTALEAGLLLGKCVLGSDELKKLFPIDSLFSTNLMDASVQEAGNARNLNVLCYQVAAAAKACLGMDPQDAILVLQNFGITNENSIPSQIDNMYDVLEENLRVLYTYNIWITKNNLSVEDFLFLHGVGFPIAFENRELCNSAIDELEVLRKSSLSIDDLKTILDPELMSAEEAIAFAHELNSAVQESLDECKVQEKELLPPIPNTDGSQQGNSSDDNSTTDYDYDTAILGLLKTLGREDAEEVFGEWKDPSSNISEECFSGLFRYISFDDAILVDWYGSYESWTTMINSEECFYDALRLELAAERTLTFIAEKFSMSSDVVAELFSKLKNENCDDFAEWLNIALDEPTEMSQKNLCDRIARCAALYQFTQTVELGFEWDWNALGVLNDKYDSFKSVLYAFAASSQIMGDVYKYGELDALTSENDHIQISDEAFDDLVQEAGSASESGPFVWCIFADLLQLYRKTNSLPSDLKNLLQFAASGTYSGYVDKLESNLKLVRTNSEWNKFVQGVHDKVRQSKRNALAAVVCHESQMPNTAAYYPVVFVDENDIYSYYLFDVKMEPDMAISRTVQAVSCIQLYVQRALMGLEGGYTLNDTQKEQWEWMKNYQVWVANRKVFLYPENWIDGDLREDKTPFFKDLEDRLAEIGNDQDALTDALGDYLKKVTDTSEIDIVGACKQDGGVHAGTLYTLHIIGCTRGEPHSYYYRTYEATALYGGSWTPWEEVPIEIDGAAIQPAILGGHLHILWLQVVQGQRQKKTGESGGQQAAVTVEHYAEIKLKWASYTGTKWTGVKVGKQAVYDVSENQLDFILGENETLANRYFLFDISDNSECLTLLLWRTFSNFVDTPKTYAVGIAGNSSDPNNASTYVLKTDTRREYKSGQRIVDIGKFTLSVDGFDVAESMAKLYRPEMGEPLENHSPFKCSLIGNIFHCNAGELVLQDGTEIFGNTRGPFKLLSVNMSFLYQADAPFFYMDSQGTYLIRTVSGDGGAGANSVPNYHVEMISNPQANEFRRRFLYGGTKWLYSRETEALPVSDSYYYSYSYYNYYFSVYLGYYTAGDWQAWDLSQTLFEHNYLPGSSVAEPFPSSMVDFNWGASSSIYNWELFFFVPMLLADKMLAEQNYAAALEWMQLVFDPRIGLSSYEKTKRFVRALPKGAKYWKFLPFFANQDADKSILVDLSFPSPHDALPDYQSLQLLIDRWKNDPFDPQMIARYRPVAYQKYVVMKYLDALIGWGDQLFTQDTTESVNLAVQMYILAAEILGPKSAEVPGPKNSTAYSVKKLLNYGNGVLNNAFVTYEDTILSGRYREKETPQRLLPGNTMQLAHTTGMMFYFNVPRNETLMGYWDTVADRLYKIRNSLNIEGVKRTLALFAPPIDPAMLVKAKANGVSISDALADASSALPYYRFKVMVAKAIEIVRDVQRVGQELMDAIEKIDAESLALLRVTHEKTALTLQRTLTELDITELEKELEAVETEEENLQAEQEQQTTFFKKSEQEIQYEKAMEKVKKVQETVENMKKAASVAYKIPDLGVGAILNGLGGPSFDSISMGGTKIAENLVNAAEGYASQFAQKQVGAALKKVLGEQARVEQSWEIQKTAKANQIKNVQKKKTTAEIKIDYAKKLLENYEREIELKDEMYEHLSEKYTNKDLYTWLKKETGSVYKTLFQLAAKVARKAEKCYHFEIGDTDENPKTAKTFIKGCGVYWDGLHSGLLAGEKLLADLHAMEVAYLENDKNELEITKDIYLDELIDLNNDCNFLESLNSLEKEVQNFRIEISKDAFDFTHYFGRIRDVQIQIILKQPSSHRNVSAELSLTSNKLWLNDNDFVENRIGVQTIATSKAHLHINQFDLKFSNDKYCPFEGAGIDSTWSLSIPGINGSEIFNIIISIKYTARKGA
ncbi:hypothetical protein B7988_11535 [Fibrobacter sp. UWB1]|uniref:Tc toxin subunit A-related protein n=1 Tax=Fibrobacter sp. UWB1 TaxID=1964355 RepID=UPI000B52855A|nr:neuraminidase-like domain-containing protein [Fibrobacter sp. UWB1]OWV25336.1 hypothetical protein B7988_11535 [Fibrobacter sp. UWB1]